MADSIAPETRSRIMSRIRKTDTEPEMAVRRLVHSMGYRYRLHVKGLPGTPDLVFPARKSVIFVHGCFWHRHPRCKLCRTPKSRQEYWIPKLEGNRRRDRDNQRQLTQNGWRYLVIWECEIADLQRVARRVQHFLEA
jgi:DNA mismatch endonuclease (patch repair protein)